MLTRLCKCVCLAVVASAWSSLGAAAQNRPIVTVSVELVAPRYRDRFANRKAVEGKTAAVFAEYLTKNVGFLRFAADDSIRPYRLAFLLDRPDRGNTSSFAEFGFWVHLERPDDAPVELYWLQLRSADQSVAGVGNEIDFLTEVRSKLAHRDADSLRSGVLRWIPISETALPNLRPLGVVLPFRLLELCMKPRSVVEFLAEFSGAAVTREVPFVARVTGKFTPTGAVTPEIAPFKDGGFAELTTVPQPDELTPSITGRTVKVKKIFVTSYVHDPTACDNRAPMAVGGGAP
jgi:hypothetical protein